MPAKTNKKSAPVVVTARAKTLAPPSLEQSRIAADERVKLNLTKSFASDAERAVARAMRKFTETRSPTKAQATAQRAKLVKVFGAEAERKTAEAIAAYMASSQALHGKLVAAAVPAAPVAAPVVATPSREEAARQEAARIEAVKARHREAAKRSYARKKVRIARERAAAERTVAPAQLAMATMGISKAQLVATLEVHLAAALARNDRARAQAMSNALTLARLLA
jgi:hypothetical protein